MTFTVNANTIFTTDQFDAANAAVQYGVADVSATVESGVFVVSGTVAVSSSQSGSELINNGYIFSGQNNGVRFTGDGGSITNNGVIAGSFEATVLGGNGSAITNHGEIKSDTSVGVFLGFTAFNPVLNNDGEIFGGAAGVQNFSSAGGDSTINNSGLIHSDFSGVLVTTAPGMTTIITNSVGGSINGTDSAITASGGRISVTNRGTLTGGIDCFASIGNVNDVITNKGKIVGEVHLGSGDDSFDGNGGTSGAVFGEGGNDRLIGSAGKDTLVGGLDKDTLTGGKRADKFVFNDVLDSAVGANRDIITDFSHKLHDKIDLQAIDANTNLGGDQAFTFIGKQQFHNTTGELRVAKQGKSVIVSGDVNGDGVADFEIEVHAAGLVKADFFL
jgi:Ca2+-binding RTX toxin-like protein